MGYVEQLQQRTVLTKEQTDRIDQALARLVESKFPEAGSHRRLYAQAVDNLADAIEGLHEAGAHKLSVPAATASMKTAFLERAWEIGLDRREAALEYLKIFKTVNDEFPTQQQGNAAAR